MKVLVTGCQGFIGSNLVVHLQSQGHEVIGMDNCEDTRREVPCELIIHNIETPIPIKMILIVYIICRRTMLIQKHKAQRK